MKSKRGAFIVLEGCDRVGKSTQVKKLANELKGQNIRVETICFPNRSTPIGLKINEILIGKNTQFDKSKLHQLFADNRREFDQWIRESLAAGTTIIADRYSFSGVAFSVANQLNKEWCWNAEKGLPKPDLILLLRMSLEKAAQRKEYVCLMVGTLLRKDIIFGMIHGYFKVSENILFGYLPTNVEKIPNYKSEKDIPINRIRIPVREWYLSEGMNPPSDILQDASNSSFKRFF